MKLREVYFKDHGIYNVDWDNTSNLYHMKDEKRYGHGWFHCFLQEDEGASAIIEIGSGQIVSVVADAIQFITPFKSREEVQS